MWNTTQFGIHAGSDVYSHSVFTKAQSPNVTTLCHLTAEHPAARSCVQKGHCRICHRSCMTGRVKETSLVLRWTVMKPNYFFLIATCILCKMQLGIWCLFLWNTVILWLMTKGRRMFFDESVATIFVFWPILKTSGQHRSQPDDTQISCCILHSEALSILLSGFQVLKMILSVEVFEERNRCLTVYTERPWQDMSSRFVLLSGVKLIPKYVILTPLLSWYKKA